MRLHRAMMNCGAVINAGKHAVRLGHRLVHISAALLNRQNQVAVLQIPVVVDNGRRLVQRAFRVIVNRQVLILNFDEF
ncbi:hypothetical protein SDC9_143289 [bioreactor metagenome]|uniref:Uncharacterized protein n=1 Tax=bioreactor metagenome TaxID=1076179 RepID=A0A645E6E8_9ZZZZ